MAGDLPAGFQRFPGHLQQHPLLRVHHVGFACRNAEKGGVEPANIAQRSGRESIAAPRRLPAGVLEERVVPAVCGNLGDDIASPGKHLPIRLGRVAAAGEPTGQANNGHVGLFHVTNAHLHAPPKAPRPQNSNPALGLPPRLGGPSERI